MPVSTILQDDLLMFKANAESAGYRAGIFLDIVAAIDWLNIDSAQK